MPSYVMSSTLVLKDGWIMYFGEDRTYLRENKCKYVLRSETYAWKELPTQAGLPVM